jgi:putative endonuclease
MDRAFYVYMLANHRNGTLYAGVTSNIVQRAWQHREGVVNGFSKERETKLLVWYEQHETAYSAITREKQIKKWNRAWKIEMIEAGNPYWRDLYGDITS